MPAPAEESKTCSWYWLPTFRYDQKLPSSPTVVNCVAFLVGTHSLKIPSRDIAKSSGRNFPSDFKKALASAKGISFSTGSATITSSEYTAPFDLFRIGGEFIRFKYLRPTLAMSCSDAPAFRKFAIFSGVYMGILSSMYLIILRATLASLSASLFACSATDTGRTMTSCKFTSLPVSTGLSTSVFSFSMSVAATAASSSIAFQLLGADLAANISLM